MEAPIEQEDNLKRSALIVVAHPDRDSFNHALAQCVADVWQRLSFATVLRDLYAERFDPVLTLEDIRGKPARDVLVREHIALLKSADLLCVVHPNCWGSPPAMMKGWMDRVFAVNAAYAFEKGRDLGDRPRSLLRTRAALVLNTSNTTAGREAACFGDPLERIWRDCLLGYCGVSEVTRHVFRVVSTSSAPEREQWLSLTQQMAEAAAEPACTKVLGYGEALHK